MFPANKIFSKILKDNNDFYELKKKKIFKKYFNKNISKTYKQK